MKRAITILLVSTTLASIPFLAMQGRNLAGAQVPNALTPPGFTVADIRFDESMGNHEPTPQIPKTWRLVGVSNGEKENNNNLWFQDQNGDIYMIQGFTDNGRFIINKAIEKLNATNN